VTDIPGLDRWLFPFPHLMILLDRIRNESTSVEEEDQALYVPSGLTLCWRKRCRTLLLTWLRGGWLS